MSVDRSRLPHVGPDAAFVFPSIGRRALANGLSLRLVEHHSAPVVTFVCRSRAVQAPIRRTGKVCQR